jgi:Transposase DDE domain group 1
VQGIAGFPKVVVSADGRGVVSHVGARLLADVAQATGLVAGFDEVARTRRVRRSTHLRVQVLAEVAVMIADGGEAIADLAVLRNQACSGWSPRQRRAGGCSTRSTPTFWPR